MFDALDETQTSKLNGMLQELFAAVANGGGGGGNVQAPEPLTAEQALAAFNDTWRIKVVDIADAVSMMDYNPSLKEGKIVNQLPLDRGGWICGGTVGVYAPALLPNGQPNPSVTFSHSHADHNEIGYDQIRTAPGKGSTQAQHINSNHPNGWCNPLGIRAYFLTQATTINACCMVDWNRSGGGRVICYGSLWAFRFLKF
jgi:hypothetical protein